MKEISLDLFREIRQKRTISATGATGEEFERD